MFIVEQDITINRPHAAVFAFLTDHTNDPRWRSDLIATRPTSSGVVGVGETFQATVKFLGHQTSDYRVTAYAHDQREEFEATSGPLRTTRITYTVTATPQGTVVNLRLAVQLNGLFRLAELVMPWLFRKQLGDFLAALKHVLEMEPAGAPGATGP